MFRSSSPAVLHGIAQAGTASQRPSNAPDGATYFDTTLGRLLYFDGRLRAWFDAAGAPLWSTSSPRYVSDHFNLATIDSQWSLNKGNDAQAVNFAIAANNAGYARGVTGNAGDGTANDAVAIGGPLVFEAEEGVIHMAARVRIDTVANSALFVGFHDTLPASTLEMPFTLSGTTYTSTATDGVGFLWDTAATTDTLRAVGVANNTDATHVDLGVVLEDATWIDLGLVINTSGLASFYVNGVFYTTLSAATRVGVDLCPIVAGCARTTTVRNIDLAAIAAY